MDLSRTSTASRLTTNATTCGGLNVFRGQLEAIELLREGVDSVIRLVIGFRLLKRHRNSDTLKKNEAVLQSAGSFQRCMAVE